MGQGTTACAGVAGRSLPGRIPQPAARKPGPGQEVVLLIDEGVHFFRFRAIYIRGQMEPAEELREAPAGQTWFEMVPLQTVAWDYGTLHEVREEARRPADQRSGSCANGPEGTASLQPSSGTQVRPDAWRNPPLPGPPAATPTHAHLSRQSASSARERIGGNRWRLGRPGGSIWTSTRQHEVFSQANSGRRIPQVASTGIQYRRKCTP